MNTAGEDMDHVVSARSNYSEEEFIKSWLNVKAGKPKWCSGVSKSTSVCKLLADYFRGACDLLYGFKNAGGHLRGEKPPKVATPQELQDVSAESKHVRQHLEKTLTERENFQKAVGGLTWNGGSSSSSPGK